MMALLPLLGLVVLDSQRPDTKAAIRDVVAEVAELAEAEDFDAARARLDEHEAALRAVPEPTWTAPFKTDPRASLEEGALLMHTRGVLEVQARELAAAVDLLEQARAQAGPGVIRLDSTYDLGVLYLEEGERYRAQLPEFSAGVPAPAPLPADAEETQDPLEAARANYLKARDWFVERLILDWRDADTRANAELVERRLRELDEFERQRQEQQDQEQQEQQEPQDGQEPQEGDEEGEESSDEEQDSGEDSDENAEGEREPQEPGEGEEPPEEESQTDEADETDLQEIHLTQEEMQRLLEALREIEEKGEEVREALRRIGRQNVDRDW